MSQNNFTPINPDQDLPALPGESAPMKFENDDIDLDKRIFNDTMEVNIKVTKQLFKFWNADRHVAKLIELDRFFEKWQQEFAAVREEGQKINESKDFPHALGD